LELLELLVLSYLLSHGSFESIKDTKK